MSDAPESTRATLAKVHHLAESGAPGEREAAQAMLAKLCKKHGITVESLVSPERDWRFVAVPPEAKKLFIQCYCFVMKAPELESRKSKKKRGLYIFTTVAECIDVVDCFDHYRKLWESATEDLFTAFCSKHSIFSGATEKDDSPMDPFQLERLIALYKGLNGESWKKPAARLTA